MERQISIVILVAIASFVDISRCLAAETRSASVGPSSSSSTKVAPKSQPSTAVVKKSLGKKSTGAMTEARAVSIVSARPEVKKFLEGLKRTKIKGVTSQIEFDRKEGDDFVIHVYEFVPDDAETGHTATFNWYHVNAKSGKVSTEF